MDQERVAQIKLQRLLARMFRIEHNFNGIWIRRGFESIPFSEATSKEAMTFIFKWLRESMGEQ